MSNKLFEAILAAQKDPTEGKALGLALAVVTATNDPLHLNRVKVTTGDKGGQTESDWLYNVGVAPYVSVPAPLAGSTVVIGYLDANPHTAVYLGTLHNLLNPPQPGFNVVLAANQAFTVQCGSYTLSLDSSGVKVNGKLIAVEGSKDTHNDTIVQANQI